MKIPVKKLQKADELLSYLIPNQTISPKYISYSANLDYNSVIELLKELSFRNLIGVKFIIHCKNEDPDMLHSYEFNSDDELADFIRYHEGKCENCDSTLDTLNIQVAFVIREFDHSGEIYD